MNYDILKTLSILFVEDEERIVKLTKDAIGDLFANFFVAYNGEEAIEVYKKNHIDIVVSDIMMPIMDGFELSKHLKSLNKDIPIVILSAFSEKERLLSAIDIGINKYLIKPIDPDELLASISLLAKNGNSDNGFINLSGGFRFDTKNLALYYKEELIPLTPKELKFVTILCNAKDTYVSHRELKRKIWRESSVSSAAIRAFVKRLRIKTDKELIINIPKIGYKISLNSREPLITLN